MMRNRPGAGNDDAETAGLMTSDLDELRDHVRVQDSRIKKLEVEIEKTLDDLRMTIKELKRLSS